MRSSAAILCSLAGLFASEGAAGDGRGRVGDSQCEAGKYVIGSAFARGVTGGAGPRLEAYVR